MRCVIGKEKPPYMMSNFLTRVSVRLDRFLMVFSLMKHMYLLVNQCNRGKMSPLLTRERKKPHS